MGCSWERCPVGGPWRFVRRKDKSCRSLGYNHAPRNHFRADFLDNGESENVKRSE